MDPAKLRAWWSHRQGLDGSLRGAAPAEVLERTGWARSIAGVSPYLTLFSRAGAGRQQADDAVAALQIHELPAARGCTYVVPASEFALALSVGQAFADRDLKQATKLGVTENEIGRLEGAVLEALARGPLDPESIRQATGSASRSLGEEGKKKGLSTTLPIALGRLQAGGRIRRVPVQGRLDQQRYQYAIWAPSPLATHPLSVQDAHRALARRFFRWVGPATMKEFQWFSGLGVKAAQAAVAGLGLEPAEPGSDRWLLPDDVAAFRSFAAPSRPQYALIGSLDPLIANRRDILGLLTPEDAERPVPAEKSNVLIGAVSDLPSHAIVDRGRLIGVWEFDVDTGTIARMTFGIEDRALEREVERTEEYVRDQLGDARSFSLDSPASRAPRIAALRGGPEIRQALARPGGPSIP